MLTKRVLEDLFEFYQKRGATALSGYGSGEARKKKKVVRVYCPKNNLVIAFKNSRNMNHNQQEGKFKKLETQGKNPIEIR